MVMEENQIEVGEGKTKTITYLMFFSFVLSLYIGNILFWTYPLLPDEKVYFWTIVSFYKGEFQIHARQAMLPGYHALAAIYSKFIVGGMTPYTLRLFSSILGIFTILGFFLLSSRYSPQRIRERTYLFVFFPIIFPMFFVIYTDVAALLFVLWMMFFYHEKRFYLSAFCGLLSVTMRQNNIIWVGFIFSLAVFEQSPHLLPWTKEFFSKSHFQKIIRKQLPYLFVFLAMAGFLIYNKGIGVGKMMHYSSLGPFAGNIYLFLFLYVFFLPATLWNQKASLRDFFLSPLGFAMSAILFALVFWHNLIDHPYLQIESLKTFYFRHGLLHSINENTLLKSLYAFSVVLGFASFWVTPRNYLRYLFYLFTYLFVATNWHTEQRYLLVPFSIWLLIMPSLSRREEIINIAVNLLWTGLLLWWILGFNRFI